VLLLVSWLGISDCVLRLKLFEKIRRFLCVDQWKESDTVSLVWVRLVKGIEDGPFM